MTAYTHSIAFEMQKFEELSDGIAIRHILSIREKATRQFHAVFMIVDILEPYMQDYPTDTEAALKNKDCPFRSVSSRDSNQYNAYLTKEYFKISKDFVEEPASLLTYKNTALSFMHSGFQHVPSSDKLSMLLSSEESEAIILRSLLPKRRCSSFVNIYRDQERVAEKLIYDESNEYLRRQITELTLKHLNFDICRFPELFGDIVFVRHHPVLRSFEVRVTKTTPGVLIQTSTVNNQSCRIKVNITDRYQNRIYLQHGEDVFDAKDRMHLIRLDETPSHIDVDVTDDDGTLILSHRNMPFLKSIVVNYAVESFALVLNKGKDNEKLIPKFSTETTHITGKGGYEKRRFGEEEDAEGYKQLEEQLMVAFFDGDKSQDGQAANKAKAHDILQRILNHSSRFLYIVDPYFEAKNLVDFIYPLKSADVQIRILSSKELSVEKACRLQDAIECYNLQPSASQINCRLSRGDHPIMHDRYLIAEGNVWLMGCSFNEFGNRATTIVKLPSAAARKIVDVTESWWSSENLTCTLSSYAVRKTKSKWLKIFTIPTQWLATRIGGIKKILLNTYRKMLNACKKQIN